MVGENWKIVFGQQNEVLVYPPPDAPALVPSAANTHVATCSWVRARGRISREDGCTGRYVLCLRKCNARREKKGRGEQDTRL